MHKVAQPKVKTLKISDATPAVEDYTLYVKLLRSGYHYAIVDKPTVDYMRHEESLTHTLASPFGSCIKLYFSNVILPHANESKI